MISLTDAARFTADSHATRKFKAWWETVIGYLILSLLILTLFSWAKVVTAEASGLLCIPLDTKIGYSYNLAKYFNSKCAQQFENKILLHYPYLLFFQWLLLSVCQNFWLKLPVVQNKFETFMELFKLLKEMESTSNRGIKTTTTNTISDKIDQVFNEHSFLSILYTVKEVFITILSAFTLCLITTWMTSLDFFKSDFECSLTMFYSTPAISLVCNLQPAQYIYVTIISNVVILLCITTINCYACYFSLLRKWEKQYKMSNSLRTLNAYKDICFCICFLKTSLQERQIILHTLTNYHHTSQKIRSDVTGMEARDYDVVKYVCDYLGLNILQSSEENSIKNLGKRLKGENKLSNLK